MFMEISFIYKKVYNIIYDDFDFPLVGTLIGQTRKILLLFDL